VTAGASVFRIEVAAVSPYYLRPWEKSSQHRKVGSGFLVNGGRVLTNYHVVDDAVDIRISRSGISKRWHARVVAVGPDVDLAVLQITEDAKTFLDGLSPVEWSDRLPSLQSRVTVRGYPTGGNSQCVTEGVVSRIDCKNYRLGVTASAAPGDALVMQIDAAINGGNSGGPCFSASHQVVGVAFQGIDGLQSIGYIIPASLARTFLAALTTAHGDGPIADGVVVYKHRLVDVPFRSQHLENSGLRQFLQVPDGETGVVISAVAPLSALSATQQKPANAAAANASAVVASGVASSATTSSASVLSVVPVKAAAKDGGGGGLLLPNDVLTHIDGVAVGDDGTVALRPGERVKLDWLITSRQAGSRAELRVLRAGKRLTIETNGLLPLPPPLPRWHQFDCAPQWVIIGGLLFVPLTAPLVEAASSDGGSVPGHVHDVYRQEVRSKFGFRVEAAGEVVVLLDVLASGDVNHGYENEGWRVLTSFNNVAVSSLASLYALWRSAVKADSRFLEFGFGQGVQQQRSIVLSQSGVEASEARMLSLHGIPSHASPAVIAASRELSDPHHPTEGSETRRAGDGGGGGGGGGRGGAAAVAATATAPASALSSSSSPPPSSLGVGSEGPDGSRAHRRGRGGGRRGSHAEL
jgi:S1-C subfamily serine protease